jgi:hypothetical protein
MPHDTFRCIPDPAPNDLEVYVDPVHAAVAGITPCTPIPRLTGAKRTTTEPRGAAGPQRPIHRREHRPSGVGPQRRVTQRGGEHEPQGH